MNYTATTERVWLPQAEIFAHFTPRERMRRIAPIAPMVPPAEIAAVPATPLPVDSTGGATVQAPMDGNDRYGICGPAMCDHVDRFWAWRQGKGVQLSTDLNALIKQYLALSGGDNGVNEDMLVGARGIWLSGIAGDPKQVIADHLDIDVTNTSLCNYAIDQFTSVQMAWSVPDDFLHGFYSGSTWTNADTPNPRNGHYTPLADVSAAGYKRLWTWGGWCWVSDAFLASVQPECFVAFSPRQFDLATGLDSKGRHVTEQAGKWVACGGNSARAQAVVVLFPPLDPGHVCPAGQHWDTTLAKCVPDVLPPVCAAGFHWDSVQQRCVPDAPPPPLGQTVYARFRTNQRYRAGQRLVVTLQAEMPAGVHVVADPVAAAEMVEVEGV